MKVDKTRRVFLLLVLATLACNLTRYRPTPPPPTAGPGTYVNPYVRAALDGATAVHLQVQDPASGAYTDAGTLTETALDKLTTALNVSTAVEARTPCPDHVRLTFIRADASQMTLSACLDSVVRLRGVPGVELYDVPLYGAMSDALAPHLPNALQDLLDF